MPLSDHNIITLLSDTHQTIDQYSESAVEELFSGKIPDAVYPPNVAFTPAEYEALKMLTGNKELKSALKKIIANNTGEIIFKFLSNVDGVTDPEGQWTGVKLTDRLDDDDDSEMLHDRFFETYTL